MSVNKISAIAASLVVLAAIVAGLLKGGSPAEERDRRMDEMRVQHLQNLAGVISLYYESTSSLPTTLAALVDGQQLQSVPMDPVTSESYEYEILADADYSLCATFDNSNVENRTETMPDEFWAHGAGRACFRLSPGYGQY